MPPYIRFSCGHLYLFPCLTMFINGPEPTEIDTLSLLAISCQNLKFNYLFWRFVLDNVESGGDSPLPVFLFWNWKQKWGQLLKNYRNDGDSIAVSKMSTNAQTTLSRMELFVSIKTVTAQKDIQGIPAKKATLWKEDQATKIYFSKRLLSTSLSSMLSFGV